MDWSDKETRLEGPVTLFTFLLIAFSVAVCMWRFNTYCGFGIIFHAIIGLLAIVVSIFLMVLLISVVFSGSGLDLTLRLVIFWIFTLVPITFASYFPNYSPNLIWQTNHRTAKSMWVLPLTSIRMVFHLQEEVDGIKVDFVFNPQPNRFAGPRYYPQKIEILRKFIQEQILATADSSGDKRIKQLREVLQVLPPGLEGEVSGSITTVESDTTTMKTF